MYKPLPRLVFSDKGLDDDLDGQLSRIRDRLGRESTKRAGDRVLKTIAGVCAANIRKVEFTVRYGGEEFVLVLRTGAGEGEGHRPSIRTRIRGFVLIGPAVLMCGS